MLAFLRISRPAAHGALFRQQDVRLTFFCGEANRKHNNLNRTDANAFEVRRVQVGVFFLFGKIIIAPVVHGMLHFDCNKNLQQKSQRP